MTLLLLLLLVQVVAVWAILRRTHGDTVGILAALGVAVFVFLLVTWEGSL